MAHEVVLVIKSVPTNAKLGLVVGLQLEVGRMEVEAKRKAMPS